MVEDFSTPVTPSTPPAPPFTQIWFLTRLFNPLQWVASPLPPPPSSPILVSIPSQVGVRSVSVVSLQRRASFFCLQSLHCGWSSVWSKDSLLSQFALPHLCSPFSRASLCFPNCLFQKVWPFAVKTSQPVAIYTLAILNSISQLLDFHC